MTNTTNTPPTTGGLYEQKDGQLVKIESTQPADPAQPSKTTRTKPKKSAGAES